MPCLPAFPDGKKADMHRKAYSSVSPRIGKNKPPYQVDSAAPVPGGGEQGIRTLEAVLRLTRFPVVLLRPTRTTLRVADSAILAPDYYSQSSCQNQAIFFKVRGM